MKKILYSILQFFFGKKQFYRFFLVLRNIGMQGLNYRNTDIHINGELYLMKSIARFFHLSTQQKILFDVGANVGNYSQQLLSCFDDTTNIYAFEPFEHPYLQLKHLFSNHKQVKVFQLGLSDKEEDLVLYSNTASSEVGGLYNRSDVLGGVHLNTQVKCQFTTLEAFCNSNQIKHIHLLKIDVEGHELFVLKGAAQLLKNRQVDFIQFEFGAGNHFSKTYFIDFYQLLKEEYDFYRLMRNGFVKIDTYQSDLEMLVLSNYVAINKNIVSPFVSQQG